MTLDMKSAFIIAKYVGVPGILIKLAFFFSCDSNNRTPNDHAIVPTENFRLERMVTVSGPYVNDRTDILSTTTKKDTEIGPLKDFCVDSKNNIYAIDMLLKKIVVFDSIGNYKFAFLENGQGPGEMLVPWCMRIYNDTLFVSERSQHKIETFTLDGQFVREVRLAEDDVQTFTYSIRRREFATISPNRNYLLRIRDNTGRKKKDFFERKFLKNGRDYTETNEFVMHFAQDSDILVVAQTYLGVMYIIDFKSHLLLKEIDLLNGDLLEGFGQSYLEQQKQVKVRTKNNALLRPYIRFIEQAIEEKNGSRILFTFYCREKNSTLFGFEYDLKNQSIHPIFSNKARYYVSAVIPRNDLTYAYLFNPKFNHLELWSVRHDNLQ